MEEIQEKTISDRELWKKAENVNKAKFLTLLGQSPATAWILAAIGVALVAGLALFMPAPDPKIKSACQFGTKVAILCEEKVFLADKASGMLGSADAPSDAIAIACGKDMVALAARSQGKVLILDWSGKTISELLVESPSAVGIGSSWIYVSSGNEIKVFEKGRQVNALTGLQSKITKSIQEKEAVWVFDYMSAWRSGPMGWIPVPFEGERDFRSGWIGDGIRLLYEREIVSADLDGRETEKIKHPEWHTPNSWLCDDLIVIEKGEILIGSPKEANPAKITLPK
jgi:hypothetical protein